MATIPLSQPDITEAEIEAVTQVLRSGHLSLGPRLGRFEEMVAERAGRRHGVAVSSGSAGLHLLLRALHIGPGDEVITTPFSDIASANAIRHAGAEPVFVDIEPRSLNLDPARVEAAIGPHTKAILAVHVFGNPARFDELAGLARRYEVPLVEDACEAIGGSYRGRPVGGFGRAAVFGFYPNKQITTGEGGMIVTDDDRLAHVCRAMRNQGRTDARGLGEPGPEERTGQSPAPEFLGHNYRLSEPACALGAAQMERLEHILAARRRVAAMYMQRLQDWSALVLPTVEEAETLSWFVFVVRLSHAYSSAARDRVIAGLRRHDIGAADYFPCIHLQPPYRDFAGDRGLAPIAESISDRTIALPFFNRMDETQVELVCQTLHVMLQREELMREE